MQLRRQSKACDAGLHEGDILLGINGFECRTMSHSSAMALLENAVDRISLSVFRLALVASCIEQRQSHFVVVVIIITIIIIIIFIPYSYIYLASAISYCKCKCYRPR